MVEKKYLWKWCWPSMSQCQRVDGDCDRCQYKKQALKRKKEKIERFDEKKGEIENEKD